MLTGVWKFEYHFTYQLKLFFYYVFGQDQKEKQQVHLSVGSSTYKDNLILAKSWYVYDVVSHAYQASPCVRKGQSQGFS